VKKQMPKSIKSSIKSLILIALFAAFFPAADTAAQSHEKIVEEVEVVNVEVPVRVFLKGKPVTGLQKNDFKLFVNGEKKEINGFYEASKKIDEPSDAYSPRLFVLMFNICDYRLDLDKALDTFFHLILRPNDRIIVITRLFFIDERTIANPGQEKENLKKILQVEKGKTANELKKIETQLKSLVRSHKSKIQRYDRLNELSARDFNMTYMNLVREFKGLYLDLGTDKYIKLAHYLKAQQVEKWVLSFYQIGRFYKPKFGSNFFRSLVGSSDSSELFTNFESLRIYDELQETLDTGEGLPQGDLVKVFAGTGATFHTMLMEGSEFISNEFAGDLSIVPLVSDTYSLLKKLADTTGGYFLKPGEIQTFYRQILFAEDIHYILTYAPGKKQGRKNKQPKIKVTTANQNHQVYYDDQKRGGYFRRIMKRHRIIVPQIRVDQVTFKQNTLSFIISNFKIKSQEQGTDNAHPEAVTKIPVRIQVFNKKSESLFDGVQMFEFKSSSLKKSKARLQVAFPRVPSGSYDVFIWAGDPLTGKRGLAVKEINIQD
jgi:hypothetical protein